MSLLKRLSDSVWDYISPRKVQNASLPTPQTAPRDVSRRSYFGGNTPSRIASSAKRVSLMAPARKDLLLRASLKNAKSQSPMEKIEDWGIRSPTSLPRTSASGRNRKRMYTPSTSYSAARPIKRCRTEDTDFTPVVKDRSDDIVTDDGNDQYLDDIPRLRSPPPRPWWASRSSAPIQDDDMSVYDPLVVSEEEYANTPARRTVVSLPEELQLRHLSNEELRANGWNVDYITLIQKLAMRGREPLLPAYLHFEYNFLPDGLFEQNDDASISSLRKEHFRASKALEKLFELGGRVRDRKSMGGPVEPEEEIRKHLARFIRWAQRDAELDPATAIPILAQVYDEVGTPTSELKAAARQQCGDLARRWKQALTVQRSVEGSPVSWTTDGTLMSYEVPTIYAIVASYTVVALMAYREDTEECTPMAYFDYADKDYDVWNSLALAIIVCHGRNVQLRIAEETMIGRKPLDGSGSEMDEDDEDA